MRTPGRLRPKGGGMRKPVRALLILAVVAVVAVQGGSALALNADTRVTVGSPVSPFSANKQNEPAVAIDANHPSVLAAGAYDNIDLEACNAGTDNTCPFAVGEGAGVVRARVAGLEVDVVVRTRRQDARMVGVDRDGRLVLFVGREWRHRAAHRDPCVGVERQGAPTLHCDHRYHRKDEQSPHWLPHTSSFRPEAARPCACQPRPRLRSTYKGVGGGLRVT